jgi:outer membrane lipoprotein-sorting protein
MNRSRITAALALVAISVIRSAGAADAVTAQHLMQLFAATKASRADFVDRKYLASLDRPLESSGELIYTAPSRFEKRTIKPKPETLIVDGDTLSIERSGTKRSISLASYPEVAAFTGSIRATLAGDYAALSRDYKIVVEGTDAAWRMTLLPSDPKIAAVVSRVTVDGRANRIDTFEVLQADGNRSITTIVPRDAPGKP